MIIALILMFSSSVYAADSRCIPDSGLATPLFNTGPTDPSGVYALRDLGHLEPKDLHVIPSNQIYLKWDWSAPEALNSPPCMNLTSGGAACEDMFTDSHSIKLQAPAQITRVLKTTLSKTLRNSSGKLYVKSYADYSVSFEYTCSLQGWYQHLHELDSELLTYLKEHASDAKVNLDDATWSYDLPSNGLSYQYPNSGSTLGFAYNYGVSDAGMGLADTRIQNGSFSTLTRKRNLQKAHGTSFIRYADSATQESWNTKLNPVQGQVGMDIPKTLQGTWFNPSLDSQINFSPSNSEMSALSIVPDNTHKSYTALAWGSRGMLKQDPTAHGPLALLDPLNWGKNCDLSQHTAEYCEIHGIPPSLYGKIRGQKALPYFNYSLAHGEVLDTNPDPSKVGFDTTVCYDLKRPNEILFDYVLFNLTSEKLYVKYYPKATSSHTPCEDLKKANSGTFPKKNDSWKTYIRSTPSINGATLGAPVDLDKVSAIQYGDLYSVPNQILSTQIAHINFKPCVDGCSVAVNAMETGKVFLVLLQKDGMNSLYSVAMAHYQKEPTHPQTAPPPLISMVSGINSLSLNLAGMSWYHIDGNGVLSITKEDPATSSDIGIWLTALNQPEGGAHINPKSGYINVKKGDTVGFVTAPSAGGGSLGIQLLDGSFVNGPVVNGSVFRYPNDFGRFVNLPKDSENQPYLEVNPNIYWFLPHPFLNSHPFVEYLDKAIQSQWMKVYGGIQVNSGPSGFYQVGQDILSTAQGVWFHTALDTHFSFLPPFNTNTGNWDSGAAAFALVPQWNNLDHTTIAWGLKSYANYNNAYLTQLDPASWSRCTSGTDAECYDKQQRPRSYSSSHLNRPFSISEGKTTVSPGYYRNPRPEEIRVGEMACYDLPHLNSSGALDYYDQLFVYLESFNTLKAKYRGISAPVSNPPCAEITQVEGFPSTADLHWKTYVR